MVPGELTIIVKALEFLAGMFPKKEDDAVKLTEWRWKSIGIAVLTFLIAMYAASFIPWLKPPYARADTMETTVEAMNVAHTKDINGIKGRLDQTQIQLNTIFAQLRENQTQQLTTDMLEAYRQICRAQNSDDQAPASFWQQRMSLLKLKYQEVTGQSWDAPKSCKAF